MPKWYQSWRRRHQHVASFALHVLAIPMLPLAGVLVVWQLAHDQWELWYRPILVVMLSYVLQWIGHLIEGNDMGEIILIKKWLNKPYTAISPRYSNHPSPSPRD